MNTAITTNKIRNDYYDYLRALAIFFVIGIHLFNRVPVDQEWGGSMVGATLWRTVISCAVPLFLAISGYFSAHKGEGDFDKYKSFLSKQIPRVYIPCFIWSLPYFYWSMNDGGSIYHEIFNLIFCGYSVYYFVLLITIFYILLPWMQKLGNSIRGVTLSIIISIISIAFWTWLKTSVLDETPPLVYSGFFFPMWMMFFVIGIYYGKGNKVKVSNHILLLALFVILIFSLFDTYLVGQEVGFLAASHSKWTNSIFSLLVIILLFNNELVQYKSKTLLGRVIAYIGRISFGIYLIHMYVLLYYDVFRVKWFHSVELSWILIYIIVFVCSVLILSFARTLNRRLVTKYLGF